jgi:tryptophan synthase alpha chain
VSGAVSGARGPAPAPQDRLEAALRAPAAAGRPALVAFLTAGYPLRAGFRETLAQVAAIADAVEVGVPFSDPMADGLTIQRASAAALAQGVTLAWILEELARAGRLAAPPVLMGYLNPFLAYGLERLAADAAAAGVAGFVVPDLPLDEAEPFERALAPHGLALVQLVTPVTPPARLARLAAASRGFLYAVTVTGVTGGAEPDPLAIADYLDRVRRASPRPVMAGFGVRTPGQVRALAPHADGVVVGSALIEALERGDDPGPFLAGLRDAAGPRAAADGEGNR